MKRALLVLAFALAACGGSGTAGSGGGGQGASSSSSGGSSGSSGSSSGSGTTSGASSSGGTSGSSGTSGDLCGTQPCLVYAETAHDLYTVDPNAPAGGAVHVCSFGGAIGSAAVNDIAVDASGVLYALTASALYRVDTAPSGSSCNSTLVTNVAGSSNYNALSFTIDGKLLAAGSDGTIAQIDLSSGSSTVVGSFATGYGSSGDFVALSDGRIFATARVSGTTDDELVQIAFDASSGQYKQQQVVGSVGYHGVFGLGFWAGTLYGFDSSGDVLTIDPATGAGTLIGNNGLTWYGAGTTPRAPIFK